MTTLNYKALLNRTGFFIFIKALGIYLLITLPVLGVPVMYMLSAGYALSFGWIAGALFLLLLHGIQKLPITIIAKQLCLYVSVAITVLIAFQMMEVLGAWNDIWKSGDYLFFPAAAIISGWISLAISRKKINALFTPVNLDYYKNAISNNSATQNTI